MEKQSTVRAVYAESLVFESSFGSAEVLATHLSSEVTKRAESIPAGDAATLSAGKAKTSGTTKLPIRH